LEAADVEGKGFDGCTRLESIRRGTDVQMARTLFTEEELQDLYVRQRLSLRLIAIQKGCYPETVRKYLVLYGISRRSVSEAKIKYPRKSFSGELTEKAYLLGFRAGDLCVHTANYSKTSQTIIVACSSTVPEQIELIRRLFIWLSAKESVTRMGRSIIKTTGDWVFIAESHCCVCSL